ncbi:MAG: integrase family protein [Planctomycetaceae bacterium]|nr:integrase family protein [Planctomycetaceae bacterium]
MSASRGQLLPTNISPPAFARTRSGIVFDPNDDRWKFRDEVKNISLRFDTLLTTEKLRGQVKRVFLWYLENLSSATAETYFANLRHFFQTLAKLGHPQADEIEIEALLTYRSSLNARNMWRLGSLAVIFKKWHDLDLPAVSSDVADFLAALRIPGNQKGVSVRTQNPFTGPLNDLEYETLLAALHEQFLTSGIPLKAYVLVLLVAAFGQRPSQFASLKIKDLVESRNHAGVQVFTLSIPRSKQRGQLSRGEFKDRVLSLTLGILVAQHAVQVCHEFATLLASPGEAPLFASRNTEDQPPGFEYHMTSTAFTRKLKRIVGKLNIVSVRTGSRMNMSTYRLRRTVGTRAAAEGHGELVIAEMLDHTDTQNVGAYVEAVPAIVERIDRGMAFHLAPLAQAFAGVLRHRDVSVESKDELREIWSPQFGQANETLGNCGEHGFCNALAPIACYTCRNFQPWADGPHDAVLGYLLEERERLHVGTDLRIASICDRTILAVSEVILKCQATKRVAE